MGGSNKPHQFVLYGILLIFIIWAAAIAAQIPFTDVFQFAGEYAQRIGRPFDIAWSQRTGQFILIAGLVYLLVIFAYLSTRPKLRRGEEHGSAQWGQPRQVNRAIQQKDSFILSRRLRLGVDSYKHQLNTNILIIGGSGAGKTRGYAIPNCLNNPGNRSMVICDPKGEISRAVAPYFLSRGMEVRVFDLLETDRSDRFNAFSYIRDELDVLRMINNIIDATTPKNSRSSDPFWEKSEIALLSAIVLLLWETAPVYEQSFAMVLEVLRYAEIHEGEDDAVSPLDLVFENVRQSHPDSLAVKQYLAFRSGSEKTLKSILISTNVRLVAFNINRIAELTSGPDELGLGELGEKPTALFLCIPDADRSLYYLVNLLITSLIQELYYRADRIHGGRLPVPVHILWDEFASTAPKDMELYTSTMRSRGISASIILQNLAQLKGMYKEHTWETLVGTMDTLVYLGGNEMGSHDYFSKQLGKESITTESHGHSKGRNGTYSTNTQASGRELLLPDEIRRMDNRFSLILIKGFAAVRDLKFDLMKHPNIRHTSYRGLAPYRHTPIRNPIGSPLHEVIDLTRAQDYIIIYGGNYEEQNQQSQQDSESHHPYNMRRGMRNLLRPVRPGGRRKPGGHHQ